MGREKNRGDRRETKRKARDRDIGRGTRGKPEPDPGRKQWTLWEL